MLLCIGVLKLTIVDMTKTLIQNNLKEYRKKAGLRQADVAKAMGFISHDRISHWEMGRAYPSIENLFKLARLYQVRIEELYEPEFTSIIR